MGLNRKGHVVQGGKIFEDACDLEGSSQPQGAATVFRDVSNVAIFEEYSSGIRFEGSGKLGNQVVFPAPFGPMTAWISPASTSMESSWIATSPPKDLESSSVFSITSAMA